MVFIPATAVDTVTAVLVLSQTAWKLGVFLSKLDKDTSAVDNTVRNLAVDVKSLGNECDLIHAELREVISKSEIGSPQPYDVDGRIWSCLASQVEEASRTMQELELLVRSVRGGDSNPTNQTQRQMKLDASTNQMMNFRIAVHRHFDNLRSTLLLIHT